MGNVAEVLENVSALFNQEPAQIYTSVGPVLIAMNPFRNLPLYTDQVRDRYHRAGANPVESKRLGPHAFRTAEQAYQNLPHEPRQSIVICGESGSGKTVTNRMM